MKHLARLQRDFQNGVLANDHSQVLPAITGAGKAAPDRQLSVYANAYRSRLREVLEIDYPVLAAALGETAFHELVIAYIDAHTSRDYSLRSFGARLSEFLDTDVNYRHMPALAELARFEWTLGRAFDANDDPLVTVKSMAEIAIEAWPRLRLVFHDSVHRIDFDWNTPALWQAHKSERPIPEVQKNAATAPWLIWRRDLSVHFRSLEDKEALLLDLARQGRTFEELCCSLGQEMAVDEVPLHAASMLKRWISDGLVSGIR